MDPRDPLSGSIECRFVREREVSKINLIFSGLTNGRTESVLRRCERLCIWLAWARNEQKKIGVICAQAL